MSTTPISVLIVESQPLMRAALSNALFVEGFDVVESVWDSQTMRTAANLTPDLILLSVGTASWDDPKSISAFRKRLPSALIVALITGEFPGQEQVVLDHGADLVVHKAVSRLTLLNTLHTLLETNQPAKMQSGH